MAYAVVAIVLGGAIGLLAGGRLQNLGEYRLTAWPLLPAGVIVQIMSNVAHGGVALALLLASYLALAVFAAANVRLMGMALVVLGLACNVLVIAVNHGMPVRPRAVIRAGIATDQRSLADIHLQAKHHYERPSDRLLVLADVIPVRPLREVLSVGDVVMSLGIMVVVSALLKKEPTHPQPQATESLPSER